ncbi:MAG: SGNH hydrolase domain-containing protein, partial [Bradyrhizobium sp.]
DLSRSIKLSEKMSEEMLAVGAKVIDPLSYLCEHGICPTVTPTGDPLYRDAAHLRPKYVRSHVFFLDPVLE